MEFEKQVNRDHYDFDSYYTKPRWCSIWYQMKEVLKYKPETVLEVGGGVGVFKEVMKCVGVPVKIVDIAEDLKPDILGSVTDLPVEDNAFDVSCAFQVLEHIPYELFKVALSELKRVSKTAVVISLPDVRRVYVSQLRLPKIGDFNITLPGPRFAGLLPDSEHRWEVGRDNYGVKEIIAVFEELGFSDVETFLVAENSYHRFFYGRVM